MLDFTGLSCATFTPMHEDGSINIDIIPAYAAYLNANNIKGIFVNGTTGEGNYSLTVEERLTLAEAWMKQKELVPHILIQVGGCNFVEAKILASHAEKIGASGIGILPNCFERPRTLDDLIEWVARIAEAAPNTPALYYHLPGYTHVDFPMDVLLAEGAKRIPTLSGLKYSSSDLNYAGKCLALKRPSDGKQFLLLFGSDETFLGHYSMGMKGAIGSSYNFAPKLFHDLVSAFNEGNMTRAGELQDQVTNLFKAIFKQGSGTSPQKYAMKLMSGLEIGPPRFPIKKLSKESIEEMERDIKALNIDHAFKTV